MIRKLIGYTVAIAILGVIFWRIDRAEFIRLLSLMDWAWFSAAIFMFVPVYVVVVARLRFMFRYRLNYRDSLTAILAASSLNILLPSKGGDLVKGVFIGRMTGLSVPECLSIVLVERVSDVSALAIIMAIGLLLLGGAGALELSAWLGGAGIALAAILYFYVHLAARPVDWFVKLLRRVPKIGKLFEASRVTVRDLFVSRRIVALYGYSLLLWAIHIAQFYCLFAALRYEGPLSSVIGLIPATLIIGLLPITVAGIGTRDAAMIVFFAPWASAELVASVALLSHLRYFVPALVGLTALRRLDAITKGATGADEAQSGRTMAGSSSPGM